MQVISYHPSVETHSTETLAAGSNQSVEQRLIGISKWAESVRRLIRWHGSHERIVNLVGEHGTGKSLVAELIHQSGSRRDGPFVVLTFTSSSLDVIRSILFGSTRDRSTQDSTQDLKDEKGLMELAREGTVYLEGLSEASDSLSQVEDILDQLSRARFNNRREGSARILLGWTVQPGLNRVNGIINQRDFETVAIPPLRERLEDLEALALHFAEQHCLQTEKELRTFSSEALEALCSYDWPQNILELRALVTTLVSQASPASIDKPLLPSYIRGLSDRGRTDSDADLFPATGIDLCNEIKRHEMELICAALKHSRGMQANAARLLHIKPTTLFMKIQRYGINVEAFR